MSSGAYTYRDINKWLKNNEENVENIPQKKKSKI